nr:protein eva-1 homolog B [Pelodiscus sinensis]|eukprot:XP_006134325.1 protein eva-1 homolog B [Pelodiscus sinensis]
MGTGSGIRRGFPSQSAAGSCHRRITLGPPSARQPGAPRPGAAGTSPFSQGRATMETRNREMELLSNSMAAYAHIRDNPESFGLYFVLGVCFGLVLTLCLLVIRISCQPHTHSLPAQPRRSLRDISEDEEEDEEDEDTVDNVAVESLLPITEIPLENHSPADGPLTVNVFASAEELERAQRLEERERIIREIWRNGQPDILGTGTVGRVHYY